MLNVFSIFIGGGLGAVLRYLTGDYVVKNFYFSLPVATFIVNVVGSIVLGFLFYFFMEKVEVNNALKFALTIGFCGGLTTFSTFSLEVFEMIKNTQFFHAIIYTLLSVIVCVIGVWIGVTIAKYF